MSRPMKGWGCFGGVRATSRASGLRSDALEHMESAAHGEASCKAKAGSLEKASELLSRPDTSSLHDQEKEIEEGGRAMPRIAGGGQYSIDDENSAYASHSCAAVPEDQGGVGIVPVGQKIAERSNICRWW